MKKSTIYILAFFLSCLQSHSQIIPVENRINWNPGIPGGIPDIQSPVVNVVDYGADSTGVNNSYNAFNAALKALPTSGGVILIPEGKFRIGSKITINRDNVVFRGTGTKSRLWMDFGDHCFEIVTYKRGSWQYSTNGFKKGSTTARVIDPSKFTVGQFAEIEQDNNPAIMYTNPEWEQSWGNNAVGQMLEVKSIKGDTITFKSELNFSFYDSLKARIRPQGLIRNVGFENFYIEKLSAEGHTFYFTNTAYCWLKNVESNHTRKEHVNITSSLGLEIRDSYFHHSFSYGDGGSGYGVDCAFHATNCLVENNIFKMLRHAMMVHIGANGNVFGYNYSINPVQGEGETNLNVGWTPPDISIHGHYPFMNLFESNKVVEIGIGDYWGPAGPGNTYFRNYISGDGILYYDESHYQNLIGNITTFIKDDTNKSKNKLEHGNTVNNIVKWDPTIPDHNLPVSYYLDTIPRFFTNESWPVYGPGIPKTNKLPAQIRYENLLLSDAGFINDNSGGILVYPNPTISTLNIQNRGNTLMIQLINLTGEVLIEKKIDNPEKTTINMLPYSPGLFLLKITDKKGNVETHRIVLNKLNNN
jgi:hypothetical protein